MRYQQLRFAILKQFAITPFIGYHLEGPPGGGKSALARDIFTEMKIEPERMLEFNASLREPTDLLGLPRFYDNMSFCDWVPPMDFYRLRDDGTDRACALLLDEINDGNVAMMNGLCRVVYDRYAGQLKLHPRLYIIATGNRTEDKSGANRMTTKLANRLRIHHFDTNIDDWCDWALNKGIDHVLVQFLRFRSPLLHDFDPNRKINPTPRAWERVSMTPTDLPSDIFFAEVAGDVGEGAASEYIGFRQIYEKLPSVDSIMMAPSKAEVPSDPAVKYALVGSIAQRLSKDNYDRLSEYLKRLPPDFEVMCVNDGVRFTPDLRNTREFVDFAVRNASLLI